MRLVEEDISEILTDHAWCEQKAASNAITLTVRYPHLTDLVTEMIRVAQEEIEHFGLVHEKIKERGFQLGRERKDDYVNDLLAFTKKSGTEEERLVDRLLFAAMIEARSCERFRVLSEGISDPELSEFYADLMKSEAMHYTMFLKFARQYGADVCDVDALWEKFLQYEAEVISKYGKKEHIHG